MDKSSGATIILACGQKPLAAFIETALAEFDVDCRSVVDAAGLTAMVDGMQPDIILLNSGFPTPVDNAVLLAELQAGSKIPVLSICEPTETVLVDDGCEQLPEQPDVLMLPFGENDLRQKIEKLTALTLAKNSDLEPGIEKSSAVPAEDLLTPEPKPEESGKKDVDMEKVEAETVKIFELTEIVEEGLPLDELPDTVLSESPLVEPTELVTETDLLDEAVGGEEVSPVVVEGDDLDFDDFGDSLDDLESDLQEIPSPDSGTAEITGENDLTTSPETTAPPFEDVLESEVGTSEETAASAPEIELELPLDETATGSSTKQPEPVAGDLDALLDDGDFAEVEIPENEDPVLAGLKNAGLTPEVKPPSVASESAETADDDNLFADDANDYEDLLDGVAAVRDESAADTLVDDTVATEDLTSVDAEAEFIEMPRPEEVLPPESTLIVASPVATEISVVAQDDESDIELPEDYLEDEELMAETSDAGPDPEIESQPEIEPPVAPVRVAATSSSAETRVFTEQQSPDFSQQIEGMTQEWSKQLLQTTYASMDKMIKAIGDLAPTIVDQVAREVIPPLAEKVIKAEIARLEEQLKLEEGEEEQ